MQIIDEAIGKRGVPASMMKQMEHVVYMYRKNYTAGHAKDVIQHGVHNGFDAWRRLFRGKLPLADDNGTS